MENMKKTYIKPETLVVAVNVKENLMNPSLNSGDATKNIPTEGVGGHGLAREVIQAPDAWEEW